VILGGFALLSVNSVYLGSITLAEWFSGEVYQDYFYQLMFLVHLGLGLALAVPFLWFGFAHLRRAWPRPNRQAVRAGLGVLLCGSALIVSGLFLTRFGFLELNEPQLRRMAYWVHVLSPLIVVWLFILHRLAGHAIRWRTGIAWAAVAGVFAVVMLIVHAQDPRQWNVAGPDAGERYFQPSLARTASGDFIPARALMMDGYCAKCHEDTHRGWQHSVHRFSSFNNPAYRFSVREVRQVLRKRDGDLHAARFCAGCHDPVPLFSGAFDDPDFDDTRDPTAEAGITCTACHAVTHVNSPRGNADYTIEEPLHYPFAYSDNPLLEAINHQLIKAKPAFHRKTFLKPLHRTAEFCGTCHKVHLPEALNRYKWLRGQDHYDAYLLSGVSGHGVSSFYYPPKAIHNCAACHMPLTQAENDFGAAEFDDSGVRKVHDHLFVAANTAVPHLLGLSQVGNARRQAFLAGALRVDIFGVRAGGGVDGPLSAPVRPQLPILRPAGRYLIETVIRTLRPGHLFTQGTSDSNQVWLDVTVRSAGRVVGRSGAMDGDGVVDPWSHFVNAYVLDREGNRIDRRNGHDIFVPLYDHQIPPGAADVVHYALQVPADAEGVVTVEVALRYRKFDTTYLRHIQGDAFAGNDLPVSIIASDQVSFPVAHRAGSASSRALAVPAWERWNDYGIGLLRTGAGGSGRGALRLAEQAFAEVERLGRADGPLNLARVYLEEGRLVEAAEALRRAASHEKPGPPWTLAWLSGQVNEQNGFLGDALANYRALVETRFEAARAREFDFSRDYRVLNALGRTLFERAKGVRGEARAAQRETLLGQAQQWFERTLQIDPENVSAHHNLALIHARRGNDARAREHRRLHLTYKPDDDAAGRVVALHRLANPAADHAAESLVIYDLQRPGTYGLALPFTHKSPFRAPRMGQDKAIQWLTRMVQTSLPEGDAGRPAR
jgi:tetratricopeptide (TPR) repeat protein